MIIDLCCGIGRFEGDDVVSIDSNPETKPSIVADIRHLPLKKGLKPEHTHASPPCTYFSKARFMTTTKHSKVRSDPIDSEGIAESLEIVAACFRAFDHLETKHWTLENPVGYLGKLLNQKRIHYKTKLFKHKPTHFWSNKRGMERAVIPQEVRRWLVYEEE